MSTHADAKRPAIVEKFATKKGDTGSPEVQVALLTNELEFLSKHIAKNPLDRHSQRGLMKKVGKRKKMLEYLHHESPERYRALIKELGLRK
jgi:small subunit ribosomal protein S15